MRIGVDVGVTNTDAVLMKGKEVIQGVKTTTTEEPGLGILEAVSNILKSLQEHSEENYKVTNFRNSEGVRPLGDFPVKE